MDFGFGVNFEESLTLPTEAALDNTNSGNSNNPLTGAQDPIQTIAGQTILTNGEFVSPNYVKGSTGWRIDAFGNVEFGSGYFRGDITGASGTFSGTITATTGAIGGFSIGADYIKDAADSFGLSSTITGGDDVRFWAGATFANRATAPFRATEAGVVTASDFHMSGGGITGGTLDIGSGATSLHFDINGNLWLGAATYNIATNPFAVSNAGLLRAVSGAIGGWTLGATSLTGTGVTLSSTGDAYISFGTTPPTSPTVGTGIFLNKTGLFGLNANTQNFKIDATNGNITAIAGTIGGWTLSSTAFSAGTDADYIGLIPGTGIQLGDSTFADAPFSVTKAGVLKAVSGTIANWTLSATAISTGAYDTNGKMYFGSSGLSLSDTFKVTVAGAITATSGTIAGWTLSSTAISTGAFQGAGVMYFGTSGLSLSNVFSVTSAGVLAATSGTIGGCALGATSIGSTTFVSGPLGSGWNISNTGTAEFQNCIVRGTIRTSVFEKDTISCVNGIVLVSSADVLTADMTAADASTITISGQTTFVANEVIRIKDGTDDEWMLVTNAASAPTYTVTRDLAAAYGANANPIWKKGTAVVSMGVGVGTKTGFILMDSSSANSPYIDIYGRNSATYSDYTLHGRFGWLKGITDADVGLATTDVWGLYTDNAYLKGAIVANTGYIGGTTGWQILTGYIKKDGATDATSAGMAPADYPFYAGKKYVDRATAPFRVTPAGALTATSATITGTINATAGYFGDSSNRVSIEAGGLNIGNTGSIRGGQTAYNTGTGVFLGYSGGAYKFSIGDATLNYLTWDGSGLSIAGNVLMYDSSSTTGETEYLIDSYSESNQSTDFYLNNGGEIYGGQSFTTLNDGNVYSLSKCKFYLKKNGSPTGNVVAKIYSHSGTYGTDGVPVNLPLATSNNYTIGTSTPLLTTSYQLITFTFSGTNKIVMSPNNHYVIVLYYNGGDGSNEVLMGVDNTAPTASGNEVASTDGSSWTHSVAIDMCFYVYGTKPGTISGQTDKITLTKSSTTNGEFIIQKRVGYRSNDDGVLEIFADSAPLNSRYDWIFLGRAGNETSANTNISAITLCTKSRFVFEHYNSYGNAPLWFLLSSNDLTTIGDPTWGLGDAGGTRQLMMFQSASGNRAFNLQDYTGGGMMGFGYQSYEGVGNLQLYFDINGINIADNIYIPTYMVGGIDVLDGYISIGQGATHRLKTIWVKDDPTDPYQVATKHYVDNKSIVRVYLSAAQTVSSGVSELVEFDTESFDMNSEFDTGTHKFTATVAGKYLVIFKAYWDIQSLAFVLRIYKNAGAVCIQRYSGGSEAGQFGTISDVLDLAVGDTISVYAEDLAGADRQLVHQSDATVLSILKI